MQPYRARPAPSRHRTESAGTRLDTDMLMITVRIATACRSELESLCIVHGIAYQGQPASTLREALKQRLTSSF